MEQNMQNNFENSEKEPAQNSFGKYMAVMFILTYLVFPLGGLIICAIIGTGIVMTQVYAAQGYHFTFWEITSIVSVGALALYGYIPLSIKMISALINDKNMFNLKRSDTYTTARPYQKRSHKKLPKWAWASLILLISAGLGILSVNRFIHYIPISGSDLTFMKVFWMSFIIVSCTAPIIAWIASIKSRRPQTKKTSVPSMFNGYINFVKSYKSTPKVEAQIKAYQKGFLDRYEQV